MIIQVQVNKTKTAQPVRTRLVDMLIDSEKEEGNLSNGMKVINTYIIRAILNHFFISFKKFFFRYFQLFTIVNLVSRFKD